MPGLPPELSKSIAMGQQRVSKGRQGSDAANLVQVSNHTFLQDSQSRFGSISTHCCNVQLIVAVVQMPQVDSDLVLSLNTPQYISEKSAAAEHAGEQMHPLHALHS